MWKCGLSLACALPVSTAGILFFAFKITSLYLPVSVFALGTNLNNPAPGGVPSPLPASSLTPGGTLPSGHLRLDDCSVLFSYCFCVSVFHVLYLCVNAKEFCCFFSKLYFIPTCFCFCLRVQPQNLHSLQYKTL